jgi:hypothetical protein
MHSVYYVSAYRRGIAEDNDAAHEAIVIDKDIKPGPGSYLKANKETRYFSSYEKRECLMKI